MSDIFEDKQKRYDERTNILSYVENNPLTFGIDMLYDIEPVIKYVWDLGNTNFDLNSSRIKANFVTDALTGEILSVPLIQSIFSIDEFIDLAKQLHTQVRPKNLDEYSLFYHLLIIKGHILPDTNGRIARFMSAKILDLDNTASAPLLNKNYEIRTWLKTIEVGITENSQEVFIGMYTLAREKENLKEFIRIIRRELPENILNLQFTRRK